MGPYRGLCRELGQVSEKLPGSKLATAMFAWEVRRGSQMAKVADKIHTGLT